jgi:hypothetical protein
MTPKLTYEEMRAALEIILDEAGAAAMKAEKVLQLVPGDDIIVGELHAVVMAAADEFDGARRDSVSKSFDEITAAASKLRNATLAWCRYVEAAAAAPDKSIPGRIDAILLNLQKRGLIVDSGQRRWSEKKNRDDIVWIAAPGVPVDYDAGPSDANAVLNFIRARSSAG